MFLILKDFQMVTSPKLSKLGRRNDGGARRDRTDDLKLAKLPLSQLSYGPNDKSHKTKPYTLITFRGGSKTPPHTHNLRRLPGGSGPRCPEPLFTARTRKSKRPTQAHNLRSKWWAWVDSNYRPHAYQACALTT